MNDNNAPSSSSSDGGGFCLSNLLPLQKSESQLKSSLDINHNGTLTVSASDSGPGLSLSGLLGLPHGNLKESDREVIRDDINPRLISEEKSNNIVANANLKESDRELNNLRDVRRSTDSESVSENQNQMSVLSRAASADFAISVPQTLWSGLGFLPGRNTLKLVRLHDDDQIHINDQSIHINDIDQIHINLRIEEVLSPVSHSATSSRNYYTGAFGQKFPSPVGGKLNAANQCHNGGPLLLGLGVGGGSHNINIPKLNSTNSLNRGCMPRIYRVTKSQLCAQVVNLRDRWLYNIRVNRIKYLCDKQCVVKWEGGDLDRRKEKNDCFN